MERLPYVGIACVTSMDQVERLATMAKWLPEGRVLALGFQVSEKTLRGERNKYPHMFPAVADLPKLIAQRYPRVEFHIHFSPDTDGNLDSRLAFLAGITTSSLDGVQINYPWPGPDSYKVFREWFPSKRIILQLGRQMVERFPEGWFADKLQQLYAGRVTDFLFDLSGGRGEQIDIEQAHGYLKAISQRVGPGVGLGVAGGLGLDTIRAVKPLLTMFPGLSWDAQSSFFDEERRFVMERARVYIERSAELLA